MNSNASRSETVSSGGSRYAVAVLLVAYIFSIMDRLRTAVQKCGRPAQPPLDNRHAARRRSPRSSVGTAV